MSREREDERAARAETPLSGHPDEEARDESGKRGRGISENTRMLLGARVIDPSTREQAAQRFGLSGDDGLTYAALTGAALIEKACKGEMSAIKLVMELERESEADTARYDELDEVDYGAD